MKKKFLHDISANTVQLLINQLFGLLIFYVLSVKLGDKDSFGEINWTLAVLLTAFSVLTCGIDQAVIKKVAAEKNAAGMQAIYLAHVIFTGLFFYGLVVLASFLFPGFFREHRLLLLLGAGKLMIFFSSPFKQVANGLERFRALLFMSICSNVVRGSSLVMLAFLNRLTMNNIVIVFIAGDIAELLLSMLISVRVLKVPFFISWKKAAYLSLLKESLPLLGVVIFTSAMARFDWIFIGLFAGNTILAEYSFAYKVFELATLPLLVIAPILIPRFTRLFHKSMPLQSGIHENLFILLRIEMVIASLSALLLNLLWIPVIDPLTNGAYGMVNSVTILILSACIPLLYFNNFLWTIHFAQGRLKMIFYIIALTFAVNIAGDLLLIPPCKAEGAATAFLTALVIQSFFYLRKTTLEGISQNWLPLLVSPACAFIALYISASCFTKPLYMIPSALLIFILLLFLSGQIKKTDIAKTRNITGL